MRQFNIVYRDYTVEGPYTDVTADPDCVAYLAYFDGEMAIPQDGAYVPASESDAYARLLPDVVKQDGEMVNVDAMDDSDLIAFRKALLDMVYTSIITQPVRRNADCLLLYIDNILQARAYREDGKIKLAQLHEQRAECIHHALHPAWKW